MLLYAWHVPPGGSAVIKIIAFHFQSLYILLVSGIRWQLLGKSFSFICFYLLVYLFSCVGTHIFQRSSSASSFSLLAVECVFPWYSPRSLNYFLHLPYLSPLLLIHHLLVSVISCLPFKGGPFWHH